MIFALIAALAAQAPAAGAPRASEPGWELVTEDGDGRILIDPASIRREGGLVHFTLRIHVNPEVADRPFAAAEMRQVIDCARRTRGYEAGRTFDDEGRQLQTRESDPLAIEMSPIEAGSAEQMLHGRLCGAPAA